MLDENIDNLNSDNLTENSASSSNSEPDNQEVNIENNDATNSKEEVAPETASALDKNSLKDDKINVDTDNKVTSDENNETEAIVEDNVVAEEVVTEEVVEKQVKEKVSSKKTIEEEPVSEEIVTEEVVKKGNTKKEVVVEEEKAEAVVEENTIIEEVSVKEEVSDKKTALEDPVSEEIVTEVVAKKEITKKEVVVGKEKIVKEKVDYNSLDLEQLTKEFQMLLKVGNIPSVKNDIEKIKLCFNQKFGELLKEKKEAFLSEGGNEIDFHFSSPIKSVFNDLLFEFKTKRHQHYKQIEEEQKENLEKRLTLIEDLKHLIDHAEPSTMYSQFRNLQDKWRSIGNIPRTKYNDTWRTYQHHVERFYDLLHLSNDLRDLDFKHNLEEKLKLVEKAEELAEDSDLNKAFKELQVLHRLWKEDIGPVDREHREEVWQRFSTATKKIHDKRHVLQKNLESKFEDNVIVKREIIDKISNLITEKIDSHSIWQQKIRELETLRQDFFKIGRVPRELNDKIWGEFKDATRNFNKIKNVFYKNIKKEQQDNLNKKNALVEKAESLKDSEDWDLTTDMMKQIQAEWKTIGHVPRKFSDKIWKRFKDACNYYFDRLHGVQDEANKGQIDTFNKKKELLENLKSQADKEEPLTLEVINSYADDWNKLGRLPNNMHHIDVKFNKTLNGLYAKLDLDEKEISMLKFKNIIGNYLANNNLRKIDNEQLFVRKKIDETTREIQQLENNISFISNADDDNPLLKNVRDNIEKHIQQLEIWKTKLGYITSLDY